MNRRSRAKTTRISFVIPALNEEKLIGLCLDSIAREITRAHVTAEIIVVDNGSTDATPAIAARHGAAVLLEPRAGLPRAKQTGLERARYPLVAFIDADCTLRRGWIGRALAVFADPRVLAASGPYHYYDLRLGRYFADGVFALMAVLHPIMPVMMGGNSIFRREALDGLGGYDTSIAFWGEDTKTAISMARIGRVKFDRRLVVESSGRRLRGQGYLNTLASYVVNTVAIRITGVPAMKRHRLYR